MPSNLHPLLSILKRSYELLDRTQIYLSQIDQEDDASIQLEEDIKTLLEDIKNRFADKDT